MYQDLNIWRGDFCRKEDITAGVWDVEDSQFPYALWVGEGQAPGDGCAPVVTSQENAFVVKRIYQAYDVFC